MLRIRLTDEDRGRLDVPEWIEFELGLPRLSDIRRLEGAVGWKWTQFEEGLNSTDVDTRLAHRAVLWWLAVNRHTPVTWEDFDIDIVGVDVEELPDPNLPAPNGASTDSTPTGPSSRGSTRSRSTRSTN